MTNESAGENTTATTASKTTGSSETQVASGRNSCRNSNVRRLLLEVARKSYIQAHNAWVTSLPPVTATAPQSGDLIGLGSGTRRNYTGVRVDGTPVDPSAAALSAVGSRCHVHSNAGFGRVNVLLFGAGTVTSMNNNTSSSRARRWVTAGSITLAAGVVGVLGACANNTDRSATYVERAESAALASPSTPVIVDGADSATTTSTTTSTTVVVELSVAAVTIDVGPLLPFTPIGVDNTGQAALPTPPPVTAAPTTTTPPVTAAPTTTAPPVTAAPTTIAPTPTTYTHFDRTGPMPEGGLRRRSGPDHYRNPQVPGCTLDYYLMTMPEMWVFEPGCTTSTGTVEKWIEMEDGSMQWFTNPLIGLTS